MTIQRFLGHGQWCGQTVRSLQGEGLKDQRQGGLGFRSMWMDRKCEDFVLRISTHQKVSTMADIKQPSRQNDSGLLT